MGKAVSGLVGGVTSILGGVKPPKVNVPPPPPPPAPMPEPDDAAIMDAKKRSLAAQQSRSGRASTILTGLGGQGSDTRLGG